MKNKPKKQELQKYSVERVKEIVLGMSITGDAPLALQKLSDGLMQKWLDGTPQDRKKLEKEFLETTSKVTYGFESSSHVIVLESFGERFRGGAKEICKQFIQDFACKTDAEKLMAETAAVALMRFLDASRRLNNCLDFNNQTSPDKNAYLSMLSKERDRSHRQYLSTISMIKQLKAPAIEMNIKTNTAFVSQNQQINVPQAPNENNEAK